MAFILTLCVLIISLNPVIFKIFKMEPKVFYTVILNGKPYLNVNTVKAVSAILSDLYESMEPKPTISVFRNQVTEVTYDFSLDRSGDSDRVE